MSIKSYLKRGITYVLRGIPQKNITASISYTYSSNKLEGKNIIVTGGGRGLGFAMAKKFVAEGANVLIAGRNEETLKKSATVIGCQYLPLDIQEIESFGTFIEQADHMLGGVNCLVNNAGISLHERTFFDVTSESFDAQFNTNLKGAYFLTQKFIENCNKNKVAGTKDVLFISSETGSTVDVLPYGLTKAALNSLVQGLAYEFVNAGFRINAVAPGVTFSDMIGKVKDDNLYCEYNVTERFYEPEEVAEVACFLLSNVSNSLNGQILVCNEGKTINARWK